MALEIVDVAYIRRHLFDLPTYNRLLLDGEEYTDTYIQELICLVIADFNSSPPDDIEYSIETIPTPILLAGIDMYALESAASKYRRNHLSYQAGGTAIDDMNKGPEYENTGSKYRQIFEAKKVLYKKAANLKRGWGMV